MEIVSVPDNQTASGDGWTVTYNLLNLPASATKGTGGDALESSWTYLADGTKIGAYHSWLEEFDPSIGPGFPEEPAPEPGPGGSGGVPSGPNALQDPMYAIEGKDYIYAGPFRLVQEMFPASITLESVAAVGGRFVMNGNSIQQRYFITDHLGSTRVVLNNAGSVLERYDYYPYGEKVPVTVANTGNTDYLYTGKESQNALFGINWYDSGARFQTTDGIFTGIDPLAEKYYHISPYAYCAGNPVNYVDPTGLNMDDYYSNVNGKYLGHDGLISPTSRLISDDSFYQIKQKYNTTTSVDATKELISNSRIISFEEGQIDDTVQSVTDKSRATLQEHSAIIVLDRSSSSVYAVDGPIGTNDECVIDYYPGPTTGASFVDRPGGLIIIGQVHGHPKSVNPEYITDRTMSGKDANAANHLQIPVFGTDAMVGREGSSVNIHVVLPTGEIHNNIGKTGGYGNLVRGNIGRTSLSIWGKSSKPTY